MIKKLLNIGFAVFFVALSCGFSINKHFCKDELQEVTVFVKQENCHSQPAKSCCTNNESHRGCDQSDQKDCCQNDSDFFKFDAPYITKGNNDQAIDNLSADFIEIAEFIRINKTEYAATHYVQYQPPLNKGSFRTVTQSFLL